MHININNKIKKFFGGNWGHPRKYTKRNTEIPEDFFDDKPVGPSTSKKKKKKKDKKKYIFRWEMCPFCKQELEIEENKSCFWRRSNNIGICKNCGSHSVGDCPSCHRETWYNPKTKIYKHQWMGCGFEGKLLKRKPDNDS